MKQRINVALQGGGAHGAFTWGVLDRLLEDPDLEIAGITGTSAGALNAAALKAGLIAGGPKNGREAARENLDRLWAQVGAVGDLRVAQWFRTVFPMAAAMGDFATANLPISPAGIAAQLYSPYAWGPFWQNPLHEVVSHFDFSRICADEGPDLFVSATNVRSGKIRVFAGAEITPAVLLASACLPTVFQAVELRDPATGHDEVFWDGGFTGNPALFPLYQPHLPDDILIISINPLYRAAIPQSPVEIQDRVNEISFNAALLGELRSIAFVKRLIAEGRMPAGAMKDLNVHLIADDGLMNQLGAGSKLSPTEELLTRLKTAGRAAATHFLHRHRGHIGKESSADLRGIFD
ncbi:patatin-like phospholipase family protein [Gemmobacter serpentinus]|uniref:patatin-like phospholipase family protein n=1 Tax=Gemmobacter serpentinus TaxID=2652247 RepID=UPI00124EA6EB|nr:patatin-like phospholipase family protein [Gemmobacter serpentinus]